MGMGMKHQTTKSSLAPKKSVCSLCDRDIAKGDEIVTRAKSGRIWTSHRKCDEFAVQEFTVPADWELHNPKEFCRLMG
jgi:hypothetical protein